MCLQIQDTKEWAFFTGKIFHRYKNMNSSFLAISKLIKSDFGEKSLINFLTNIYKENSSKKKTDLIQMIVYGCITDKLNKEGTEHISTKQAIKY